MASTDVEACAEFEVGEDGLTVKSIVTFAVVVGITGNDHIEDSVSNNYIKTLCEMLYAW